MQPRPIKYYVCKNCGYRFPDYLKCNCGDEERDLRQLTKEEVEKYYEDMMNLTTSN